MIQIDMEMPESCPKCRFYQDQHNTEYCIVTGYGLKAEDLVGHSLETAKPYWCPLKAVVPEIKEEDKRECSARPSKTLMECFNEALDEYMKNHPEYFTNQNEAQLRLEK